MVPKVSIIILNWNGWKDTVECLESLYQIKYPNYNVILVDNGSKDSSIQKIKDYCKGKTKPKSKFFKYTSKNKPIKIIEYTREEAEAGGGKEKEIENLLSNRKLILVKNEKNYGFAEGNNIGMRYALKALNPDYVLLLNNDTVVDKEFLGELVRVAEGDERIGIIGPKIYYYDRRDIIYYAGANINFWLLHSKGGEGKVDDGQFDNIKEIDAVSGCAILVKSYLLKNVGELDPEYFAYYEEIDWCIRAKRAGYKVVYAPKAIVFHKGAESTGQRFNPIVAYYKTRNLILFMRKNGRRRHWLTFIPYFMLLFVVRSLRAIWHFQPRVIWLMFKGVGWNVKNFLRIRKVGWKQ